MDAKTFSLMAGAIFAVVALFHLVRIFAQWTIIIGDWSVPKSVSWVALVVAGGLALLGLRLRQGWRRNEDQTPADPCVSKDFALAHRKKAASTEIRTSSRTRRKDGKQR